MAVRSLRDLRILAGDPHSPARKMQGQILFFAFLLVRCVAQLSAHLVPMAPSTNNEDTGFLNIGIINMAWATYALFHYWTLWVLHERKLPSLFRRLRTFLSAPQDQVNYTLLGHVGHPTTASSDLNSCHWLLRLHLLASGNFASLRIDLFVEPSPRITCKLHMARFWDDTMR